MYKKKVDEALKSYGPSIVLEKDRLVIKLHTILLQNCFEFYSLTHTQFMWECIRLVLVIISFNYLILRYKRLKNFSAFMICYLFYFE